MTIGQFDLLRRSPAAPRECSYHPDRRWWCARPPRPPARATAPAEVARARIRYWPAASVTVTGSAANRPGVIVHLLRRPALGIVQSVGGMQRVARLFRGVDGRGAVYHQLARRLPTRRSGPAGPTAPATTGAEVAHPARIATLVAARLASKPKHLLSSRNLRCGAAQGPNRHTYGSFYRSGGIAPVRSSWSERHLNLHQERLLIGSVARYGAALKLGVIEVEPSSAHSDSSTSSGPRPDRAPRAPRSWDLRRTRLPR